MSHSIHTKFVGTWLPHEVVNSLDAIAEKENRTRSNLILCLITQQLAAMNMGKIVEDNNEATTK